MWPDHPANKPTLISWAVCCVPWCDRLEDACTEDACVVGGPGARHLLTERRVGQTEFGDGVRRKGCRHHTAGNGSVLHRSVGERMVRRTAGDPHDDHLRGGLGRRGQAHLLGLLVYSV
jgi:hypothetical protein